MSNLVVGGAVSVSHGEAGHRYECKVVDIEDGTVLLHWHGYKRKLDFWLDLGSDRIGSIEAADVEPPRPAKSLKKPDVLTTFRDQLGTSRKPRSR